MSNHKSRTIIKYKNKAKLLHVPQSPGNVWIKNKDPKYRQPSLASQELTKLLETANKIFERINIACIFQKKNTEYFPSVKWDSQWEKDSEKLIKLMHVLVVTVLLNVFPSPTKPLFMQTFHLYMRICTMLQIKQQQEFPFKFHSLPYCFFPISI